MDDSTQIAFDAALSRFVDGEPEPGDADMIVRMLRDHPELTATVTGILAIDDLLRQQAEPHRDAFVDGVAARLAAERSSDEFIDRVDAALETRHPRRRAPVTWLPWLLTAAAVIMAMAAWWPRKPAASAGAPAVPVAAGALHEVLALMVNEADAKFAPNAAPDAVSFSKGDYNLTRGAAHLRFRNGADMVVLAPARFTIDSALGVRMQAGSLRVFAPPSAHGFVVAAPGVKYRDLGTEFGVTVVPDRESKLYVFDGEVQVIRDGDRAPRATITEGQSVKVAQGQVSSIEGPSDGQFPTPGEISLRRWQSFQAKLKADPNLVFYFPFVAEPNDPRLLKDVADAGAHVDGRIEGAEWVTGRWPGKNGLQFEHGGDRVALNIPGEYAQMTLAAWIKVDRFENAMNAILSSVGWNEGCVQWQLNRFGNLGATSVFSQPKRRLVSMQIGVPADRWVFVAVTIDRATGRMLHYINGRQVGEARIAPGTVLRPSQADIGMWEKGSRAPIVRDFRGRIDEMEMWRVVLPQSRISELADAGMPIELPRFAASR